MAKYRILTLDGGGIRGVLTARLLERLEEAVPGWLSEVDLIAGTSTGGIIALGLASGLTPTQIRNFYEQKGSEIFKDTWLDDLKDMGRLLGAEYSTAPLRAVLEDIFHKYKTLADLPKKVLIPAFDLKGFDESIGKHTWKAKFFHNFRGKDSDGDEKVVDVALYTSAAPTYFPTVARYTDGGVVVNNPSMAALAQTQDRRSDLGHREYSGTKHPALNDIVLLSLGTGNVTSFIDGTNLDWGFKDWSSPLLQILLDSPGGIPDYQCRQLLGEGYRRLNPVLPTTPRQKFELDDLKTIPLLLQVADEVDLVKCGIVDWFKTSW